MENTESSTSRKRGVIVVKNLSRKIYTGERRRDFLERKLKSTPETEAGELTRNLMKAEISFLNLSLDLIQHHRACLTPETSPYVALSNLIEAIEPFELRGSSPQHIALDRALGIAHGIIEEASSV
jgi:hypothetical protein